MEPTIAIALAKTVAEKTGLSKWLGKKLGNSKTASKVVEIAESVMGGSKIDEATEEQVKAMREALMANEIDLERIYAEDRNSARDMQKAALSQDDVFSKRFIYYLASFWSAVSALYVFLITFIDIPEDSVRFADTCLGFILGTVIATIINFFYGSSMGSKIKGARLHKMRGENE